MSAGRAWLQLAANLDGDTGDGFRDAFASLSQEEQAAELLRVMDDDAADLVRQLGGPDTPFDIARLAVEHLDDDRETIESAVGRKLDDLHVALGEAEAASVYGPADQWWDRLGLGGRSRLIGKRTELLAAGGGDLDPGDVRRNGGHRTPLGINKIRRDHERNGDGADEVADEFTDSMGTDGEDDG